MMDHHKENLYIALAILSAWLLVFIVAITERL